MITDVQLKPRQSRNKAAEFSVTDSVPYAVFLSTGKHAFHLSSQRM